MTKRQIAALKYLVTASRDAIDTTKRIIFLLIEASNDLTEPVSVCLWEGREGFNADELRDAAYRKNALRSSIGTTHLDELFVAMGSPLVFSTHYGHYQENGQYSTEGQFGARPHNALGHEHDREMPLRFTFWLAPKHYGHSGQGRAITTSRQELEAVDISIDPLLEIIYSTKPELESTTA